MFDMTGAQIIRSHWHSLMFECEDNDQWIAFGFCSQGNGRTAQYYILEGRKKRSSRRQVKTQAMRQRHAIG
ncbi:hypothetical protein HKX23_03025 [Sulfitobacter sp. KE29]|uniref:hypothetical protein n=1 Tax=unclassified Sulfitobacter TaxID=196795 RepID=UPI0023E1A277|nr:MULTISPECIES: hypothetical protein [unclassified Sulfitobacter]MDF3417315.1 hypothetical protein [Sulfitobacter sp. Ks38]MDF3424797.1 hypothetical protein [Sulfitobacter sp. KE29]MDF3428377.1 hypothetical protein [Sulfitobacter sp. S46]MDF3443149.1 hypothetical protein [Sulfitobacter sp. KE31]MDF3547175.1 hypothetical protein [Sulfitobacter sp. KE28]|tara:strand:- start:204 stop:416 length:213 start_codon:yes stop_codon:yes gene_type:complete